MLRDPCQTCRWHVCFRTESWILNDMIPERIRSTDRATAKQVRLLLDLRKPHSAQPNAVVNWATCRTYGTFTPAAAGRKQLVARSAANSLGVKIVGKLISLLAIGTGNN